MVEAIPLSDVPTYVLQNEKNFSDSFDLYRKVEANFSIWKSHLKLSNNFRLDCKGCCEIDNFTGNELLRVYHDIIGKKQAENSQKHLYKPGDFFYLSKNKKLCAGIMFTKTKLVVSTPESSGKETEERSYKFLYTKLYTVDPAKKYGDDVLYDPTVVEELRKSAQEQFPDFLNKKIKDFELCPYGYSFLSVLVPVAYRISWRGNPQNFPKEHSLDYDIPFAACLKFAFDKNRTGMISGLCGEGGYKEKEVLWEERAETIVENAKQLINRCEVQ